MTYEEAMNLIEEHVDYGGSLDKHALAIAIFTAAPSQSAASSDVRDAARYRWIRRRAVMMDYSDETVTTITLFKDEGPSGEFLDDQIDGEMAKEKANG